MFLPILKTPAKTIQSKWLEKRKSIRKCSLIALRAAWAASKKAEALKRIHIEIGKKGSGLYFRKKQTANLYDWKNGLNIDNERSHLSAINRLWTTYCIRSKLWLWSRTIRSNVKFSVKYSVNFRPKDSIAYQLKQNKKKNRWDFVYQSSILIYWVEVNKYLTSFVNFTCIAMTFSKS